jgi:hypothetical protein
LQARDSFTASSKLSKGSFLALTFLAMPHFSERFVFFCEIH